MRFRTLAITFLFVHAEIQNFLNEEETELIIDMAKAKGTKNLAPTPPEVQLPEEITAQYFDKWDKDFDGHLSKQEVILVIAFMFCLI